MYLLILPVRALHHALMAGIMLFWLYRRGLPKTPFSAPILGMLGVVFISAISSGDPRMALENAWFWLMHALLFLLLIDLIRHGYDEALFRGVFIAGALVAGVGIVQAAFGAYRPASLLLIINTAGSFAGVVGVLAMGWWYAHRQRRYALLAVLLVIFVVLNGSRGGLLALIVGLGVFTALESILHKKTLIFTVPLMVLFIILSAGRLSGDLHRLDIWRSAFAMIHEQPLLGVGPGLFGQAYRHERVLEFDYVAGAHSIPLNIASELGAAGLMCAVWLAITFAAYPPINRPRRVNAALAALAGALVNGLFDTQLATAYAFPVLLCAAFAFGHARTGSLLRFGSLVRAGAILVTVGFVLFFAVSNVAQIAYERSLIDGDVSAARTAIALDPNMRLYRLHYERLLSPIGDARLYYERIQDPTQFSLTNYARFWR